MNCKKGFEPSIRSGEKFCGNVCATEFLTSDINKPYNEIGQSEDI